MPSYTPPSTGGGGGVSLPIAESDVTNLVSDLAAKAPSTGIAESAVTGLAADLVTAKTSAFLLGKAGAIGATETNAADFPFIVPYGGSITKMKAVLGSPASGAMTVQLRKATAPGTAVPSYSDLTGYVATFANGSQVGTVTPGTALTVAEGDLLNFSCATGSGVNLTVEAVVAKT